VGVGAGHDNCDKYSCMTSIRCWTDQMHACLLLLKFETYRQIMICVCRFWNYECIRNF